MIFASRMFFAGIQALRFVAATMVVAQHALYAVGDRTEPNLGRYGVVLFFAISGFVIALQRNRPIAEFASHRLLRIYPAFFLALLIEAAIRAAQGMPVGATIGALLLLPASSPNPLTAVPYWTLVFEITFYVIAGACFALRLRDSTLTILSVAWIGAIHLLGTSPAGPSDYSFPGKSILLSSAMQVLPMGLLAGINYRVVAGRTSRPVRLFVASAMLAASFVASPLSIERLALMGAGSAFLVMSVADLAVPRFIRAGGDASYGIYLLHFPIIVALANAPLAVTFGSAMTAGLAFGLLEFRMYRWAVSHRLPWYQNPSGSVPGRRSSRP